ncbi:MAG: HAMP domain-containing histidine kinase [Propionibacterium sp.]|nr:HAMP domain-containing histidine kinase [Propionibacterium sp.]
MTDSSEPAKKRKRRSTSIRQRIATAMVALVVVSLTVTGAIVLYLEGRSDRERVDAYLLRTRDEFAVLAQEGVDTETGMPFEGPSQLLRTFISRTMIDQNEGELGIVDGRIRWISSDDVVVRPEQDEELMAHILPLSLDEETRLGTYETSTRTYRYHLTPVVFPVQSGALLHVYDLDALDAELRDLLFVFGYVALATSLISALVAFLMVGRLLRPIEDLREAAESISETDLTSRVPLRGNDDLTRLSKTVNRMLDRVETSMDTQRQLLDDVGHELRTPITIVRGHLELIDPTDPQDVSSTRDLAIDELDRMGVLVGDLLMLAKANQSDFVQPQWFSLGTLTDQVLEKARALGDRSWRLRHIESIDAWLDPDRITQAWLQLAANAVKYSRDGSAITLASKVVRGSVHLSVEDQGIGIAEEDLESIRTRFGRGSNTGRAVGAGLGLSIVETIVSAHHGRLEIESEVGVGSTFTIIIPLSPKEIIHEHDSDS